MRRRFLLFAALALVLAQGACIKTELRHCVDGYGNVQPEQVCVRGQAGNSWVYGGRPDPNNPNRLIEYTMEPSEGSTVVGKSGVVR